MAGRSLPLVVPREDRPPPFSAASRFSSNFAISSSGTSVWPGQTSGPSPPPRAVESATCILPRIPGPGPTRRAAPSAAPGRLPGAVSLCSTAPLATHRGITLSCGARRRRAREAERRPRGVGEQRSESEPAPGNERSRHLQIVPGSIRAVASGNGRRKKRMGRCQRWLNSQTTSAKSIRPFAL